MTGNDSPQNDFPADGLIGEDRLVIELARGATVKNAADSAGMGERTAYRRLDEPTFRRRIADARGQLVARATGKLANAGSKAVDVLLELLDSELHTVRLGAARSILEIGSRLRETVELEDRVHQLEAQLGENER